MNSKLSRYPAQCPPQTKQIRQRSLIGPIVLAVCTLAAPRAALNVGTSAKDRKGIFRAVLDHSGGISRTTLIRPRSEPTTVRSRPR